MVDPQYFEQQILKEVKYSRSRYFVADVLHNVELQLFNVFNFKFLMSNLFIHDFHLDGVIIFIFRGYEHHSNTDNMQICHFSGF